MFRDLPKAGSGPAEKQPKAENAYDMASAGSRRGFPDHGELHRCSDETGNTAIMFFEGFVTSIFAHVTGWLALSGLTIMCRFLGHVVGVLSLRLFFGGP
jgi:hypothetical protein